MINKELTAGELSKHAQDYLTRNGAVVWRNNNLAVRGRKFIGKKGVSDIIGYMPFTGLWVACEIKTVNDRLSDEQVGFLNDISRSGGFAYLCRQNKDLSVEIVIWSHLK